MDIAEDVKGEPEFKPRGEEYLRGYRAAMEYAADFVKDASARTQFKGAFQVVADHFREKVAMTESSAAIEAQLISALHKLSAPAGYSKLPAGVRCRCPKLWFDGTDHYCCKIASAIRSGEK